MDYYGGRIRKCSLSSNYGKTIICNTRLEKEEVWASHGDSIHESDVPTNFTISHFAYDDKAVVMGVKSSCGRIRCLQFHPEVGHTPMGDQYIQQFLEQTSIVPSEALSPVADLVENIRQRVGPEDHVVLGFSGGIDSSVAAKLIDMAIGDRLTCIFVNNGLMREGETEEIKIIHHSLGLHRPLVVTDRSEEFLSWLEGIPAPETKRSLIGTLFVHAFDSTVGSLPHSDRVKYLAQGTLYSDVIESGDKATAKIKTHHNVGGLPEHMKLSLLEPLRTLFKDEVRAIAKELEFPREVTYRQPFPGPGLAIRIAGDITSTRLWTLRRADKILQDEMKSSGWYWKVWQSFCVYLPIKSVGVKGDKRVYEDTLVLRIVNSKDAMTANWTQMPYDLLGKISNRITSEVGSVGRVLFDVTNKPPGTIEWE